MTKRTTGEGASAGLPVPAGGDPASMDAWAEELVDRARTGFRRLVRSRGA